MKVLGIVAEYNPFHNGHLYHIQKSKEATGCDYVVCVMSGNFIQRGEPALLNKWARAEMALINGVDLVIELPVYYSLASAEFFAFGSVKLLDSLGIIDCLCFGSESGTIKELDMFADVFINEPESYKMFLSKNLKLGYSFPKSRSIALSEFLSTSGINDQKLDELSKSNNILGIEYIKALKRISSAIKPYTIERIGTGYRSEKALGKIASATAAVLASMDASVIFQTLPTTRLQRTAATATSQSSGGTKATPAVRSAVAASVRAMDNGSHVRRRRGSLAHSLMVASAQTHVPKNGRSLRGSVTCLTIT
jgi:predicted nucleotidyltransferase